MQFSQCLVNRARSKMEGTGLSTRPLSMSLIGSTVMSSGRLGVSGKYLAMGWIVISNGCVVW
jgi:hypothetical protein